MTSRHTPGPLSLSASVFLERNDFVLRSALAQSPTLGPVDVTDSPFCDSDELAACVGVALRIVNGTRPSPAQVRGSVSAIGIGASRANALQHFKGLTSVFADSDAYSKVIAISQALLCVSLVHQWQTRSSHTYRKHSARWQTPGTRRPSGQ